MRPFWTPVRVEMGIHKSRVKLKKKGFKLKSEKKKKSIGMQVTFDLEIQFQKVHLLQIVTILSATDLSILNPC